MRERTVSEGILDTLRENPKATNEEIAAACKTSSSIVKTLISRFKQKGFIEDVSEVGDVRT